MERSRAVHGRAAVNALEIVRQLARMSHPYDEFNAANKTGSGYASADDYADDLSSDRMEDDARALWRLIEEARKANCHMCAPRGIDP
jgi:hypothetical protein